LGLCLKMQTELVIEMGEEKFIERELNQLLEVTLKMEWELETVVQKNN